MGRLKLVLPAMEFEDEIMNYKKEFIENNDSMDGTRGLSNIETFSEWYIGVCNDRKEETVRKGLVPSTTYLVISTDDGRLVGMVDIRHRLDDQILKVGGHIGGSVRKSERQRGYGTEMLSLALEECKRLKIKEVLITCNKDNIASAKTIINNGGKLENELQEGDTIFQRYWITLD
ncbi:GNAT family N-acetyltransferase [Tissierella sp. MB52-C2]|uniref:GNAT family N-acetyltransferase n=1 Tax=Tissierella sp. MB52-C2 TaxID=3070999 RepID=UPI00280B0400|nr:GNAT family N-acetyltransferase [Tissierella sp. MB52-C2]WMM23285.1 GNAT family N-acetyltransferase [Tissierella sp. MB52-C2]